MPHCEVLQVKATPSSLEVHVPCNSLARLCAPRAAAHGGPLTAAAYQLFLDGQVRTSTISSIAFVSDCWTFR